MPVVVHRVGEQRSVGNDRAAPRAAEQVVQREERSVGAAPEYAVVPFVQPDPVRVTIPIAATSGLLIAIDGHTAQRDLDVDGWFDEREGKGDVQRFFRKRGRL